MRTRGRETYTYLGYSMPDPYESGIGWTVNDGAFGYFYAHDKQDVFRQWAEAVDRYVLRDSADEYVDTREGWRRLPDDGDRTSASSVRTQEHWLTERFPNGTTRTWIPE